MLLYMWLINKWPSAFGIRNIKNICREQQQHQNNNNKTDKDSI